MPLISWTPEGCKGQIGLNFFITFKGKWWFRFTYAKIDLRTGIVTVYYWRFRTICKPWNIFDKWTYTLLERDFFFVNDYAVVNRVDVEDYNLREISLP